MFAYVHLVMFSFSLVGKLRGIEVQYEWKLSVMVGFNPQAACAVRPRHGYSIRFMQSAGDREETWAPQASRSLSGSPGTASESDLESHWVPYGPPGQAKVRPVPTPLGAKLDLYWATLVKMLALMGRAQRGRRARRA